MTYTVTLDLPDNILQNANHVASKTDRPLAEVLIGWLNQMAADLPVEQLSDTQVLAVSNAELEIDIQTELSDLLAFNREGALTDPQRLRLEELMQHYRHNLIRKAQAVKVAVERDLLKAVPSLLARRVQVVDKRHLA